MLEHYCFAIHLIIAKLFKYFIYFGTAYKFIVVYGNFIIVRSNWLDQISLIWIKCNVLDAAWLKLMFHSKFL